MTESQQSSDGFRQLVRQSRLQMQRARNEFWGAKLQQSVGWDVRQKLAKAALQYYDTLWEYKEKKQGVSQAWEQSNVDRIRELADETATMPSPAPGDTTNGETIQRPAILAADPEYIVGLSKEMDSLAADLGFTAGVESDRPVGRLGNDDMWEDGPEMKESTDA